MPRKPSLKKETIQVLVNGTPVKVVLHPPTGRRTSWFAYWNGLVASKSTGQSKLEDAIRVAHRMVTSGCARPVLADAVLTDEEFEEIQRAHFNRKTDPAAKLRAQKTLDDCLEAIAAFRDIAGIKPVTTARVDDCAIFQRKALMLPKNWRKQYPNSQQEVASLSPNTVLKWSRALQAAFDRACRSAGRKSVRGVVEEQKLLTENPWKQFTWIEGTRKPIRQFDGTELLALIDYLEEKWLGVGIATAVAKACLWSWGRRAEVMGLKWELLRTVGDERHFEIVGKWGIEKWFRVPEAFYQELQSLCTGGPFVFAAYPQQLREFYERRGRQREAKMVAAEFKPVNLGDWFHEQIVDWSTKQPKGRATLHVFRKTSLQYARCGEDLNRQVAADARLSEGVMMTNYVKETDEQMRAKSNRMYRRILASLDPKVAQRYGHAETEGCQLKEQLQAAIAAENWMLVDELTKRLRKEQRLTRTG
ncbi:MAG: hypothetical protein JNM56_27310 [Planctomycetia bacterium]|nr:hypothetical protein [Planctomycetia bacterium]